MTALVRRCEGRIVAARIHAYAPDRLPPFGKPELRALWGTAAGPLRGKREFRERAHAVFLSAFPDLRMTVEGTVAEGDEVVVRWSLRATHGGDGRGSRPRAGRSRSGG